PTSTMPVTAITTFLPTIVSHSTVAGLLGHTVRERRSGAGGAWSTAVPASIGGVMDWLILSSVSVRIRRCQAPRSHPFVCAGQERDACQSRQRGGARRLRE